MDIDNISEEDLINALGDLSVGEDFAAEQSSDINIDMESSQTPLETLEEENIEKPIQTSNSETVELNSDSINSVATLLKELLKNKTIEITIKIKD